jgi:hypothetical protein
VKLFATPSPASGTRPAPRKKKRKKTKKNPAEVGALKTAVLKLEIFLARSWPDHGNGYAAIQKDQAAARRILLFRRFKPGTRINWHSRQRYSAQPNSPFGILRVIPHRTWAYLNRNGDEHFRTSPMRKGDLP